MNCRLFETSINDLARASVMDAGTRAQALAHADACERCAARLRDERMLSQGLRNVAASLNSREAPARVEAALLAAFREQHSTGSEQSRKGSAARRWARWAIAAAATVLILLTVAALRRNDPPQMPVENARDAKAEQAAPAPAPRGDATPSTSAVRDKQVAVYHRPRRAGGSRVARNSRGKDGSKPETTGPEVSEIATEFIPIVHGDNLNSMESGQIMRVELPRSALISFGLPMNMERADERIKADVVIGNDGMARAIRFVR
jgi:hypothetical protein